MLLQILPVRFETIGAAQLRFPRAMIEIFNPEDETRIPAECRSNVFDLEHDKWGFRVIASMDRIKGTFPSRHFALTRIYGPRFENVGDQINAGIECLEAFVNFQIPAKIGFVDNWPHPEIEGDVHIFF